MSWIPGYSSKPIWDAFKRGTIRILRDQRGTIMDPLGLIRNIMNLIVCFMENTWFEVEYSEVSVGGLTEILSHPAPFYFQIARYTETEGLSGFYPAVEEHLLFFIISAVSS